MVRPDHQLQWGGRDPQAQRAGVLSRVLSGQGRRGSAVSTRELLSHVGNKPQPMRPKLALVLRDAPGVDIGKLA